MRSKIRKLNDAFRSTFSGGRVLTTTGIASLPKDVRAEILERVRTFADFNKDNDPYGERDFGSIDIDGTTVFWKIDYYDADQQYGSEDPANPSKTTRVLTIMLAEEY